MAEGGMEEPLVLHRILSFLTPKQAAKSSLLSKAWLEAWRTRPTLEFDDKNLFHAKMMSAANLSYCDRVRVQQSIVKKFSRYVETTMRRYSDRKIRIDRLKLKLVLGVIRKSDIGESIRIAIENNVRTLDLCLSRSRDVLGENLFGGKSIVNLKLRMCKLRALSIDQIRCHDIKNLDFDMVYLDGFMLENIIHCCPLLELLKIGKVKRFLEGDDYSYEHEDSALVFRIKKHANLQQIDFELLNSQSLLLGELPRLESLVCTNDRDSFDDLQDLSPGGWRPCYFALQSPRYQNMITLVLRGVGIGDDFFNNFVYMFPNVEDLSIRYCHNLRMLRLSSPSIKRIGLGENQELKEAHFDVPRIVYFEFGSLLELAPVVSFTAVSGGWVSSLKVDSFVGPSLWFRKLKDLLSSLHQSEIFLIIAFPEIPEFNVDETRSTFVSSEPVTVQELSVSFPDKASMSSTLAILDTIFWVCRPRIIKQHLGHRLCMKLLYEILILKRNQDKIRLWQIDLKDVQVGTFKSNEWRGFGKTINQQSTYPIFYRSLNVYELLEMGDNVLDWEGFLLSRSIAEAERTCFMFEWRGLQNKSVNGSLHIGVGLQND